MARIAYDDKTAAAFKAVREVPRAGLDRWREAVRRHLRPMPGMTVADIGAGTGVFATAVLIRQAFPGRSEGVEIARWFPETARTANTFPSLEHTCQAFAAAGFSRDAIEQVPETYQTSLAEFLARADTYRRATTVMRDLTDEEFLRGKERLRRAAQDAEESPSPEPRINWLDLLVLR